MLTKDELGQEIAAVGALIGLLRGAGSEQYEVNSNWFADPVAELLQSPRRVKELLDVIGFLFNPVEGTQYTLLHDQAWYDINSNWDELPTGLCLVIPNLGAASGVISLGIFSQLDDIGDLVISITARIPLFYLEEGKDPQFILTSDLPEYKYFELEIDAYSPVPIQTGTDSAYNMAAFSAKIEFHDGFTTDFNLSFYKDFDPKTGAKTLLPPADIHTIIQRIGDLVVQSNNWLNMYIGDTPITIGDILSVTGLVTETVDPSGKRIYHFDEQTFEQLGTDPTAVLKKFLINLLIKFLDETCSTETPLLQVFGGGIYAVKDPVTHSYGLRFSVPDYQITSPASGTPQITVQLGKWFSDETGPDNWVREISKAQPEPGIDFFFLKYDGQTLATTARIELVSIGFDISGANDAPLINIQGYTLKRAELRALLNPQDNWTYGFAIRLDEVGFPIGPDFKDTQQHSSDPKAHPNIVAQNILASGASPGASQEKSSVSPVFSTKTGYIKNQNPWFAIYDSQGLKTDLIWFPIQRRFGPVNCQKIGLKFDLNTSDDPRLGMLFDGSIALNALDVYLDQLSLSIPLKRVIAITGYDIDLKGLDVHFHSGDVGISGGLLRMADKDGNITYVGEALIQFSNICISAFGLYSSLPDNGGTSMFIFGVLNKPLGGPAFFYVTGLAAGFGYNRALRIPAQNEVAEFPLLKGLTNRSIFGDRSDPQTALTSLIDWIPPERGEYWLAAGLQFTTFEIIKTNAILFAQFGKELILGLLGTSILKQPTSAETYVYAELDVDVVIRPEQGEVKATAVLSPNSYVLNPSAHLTGGFAFYAWFGENPHAGDFVFTIGGYHPAFNAPLHYPQVPRLGINWHYSDHISIIGEAYFAITPQMMMAGGRLALTFQDGSLRAWLKAQIDMILFWNPFYLIAEVAVSVGVSYHIHFLFVSITLSVEIGVDFKMWGPPTGGRAYIDWYIISFSIGFGEVQKDLEVLNWEGFKQLLPTKPKITSENSKLKMPTGNSNDTPENAYLHIVANNGIIQDNALGWQVRPGQFQFTIGSVFPASTILVNDTEKKEGIPVGIHRLNGSGVQPEDYDSTQTITITSGGKHIDLKHWAITTFDSQLPKAIWFTTVVDESATVAATTGIFMQANLPTLTNPTPEMEIDRIFSDRIINNDDQFRLPLSATLTPYDITPRVVDSFPDIGRINNEDVVNKRAAVFMGLQKLGITGWSNDPLPRMAANPGQEFTDEPLEGPPNPAAMKGTNQ